MATTMLSSRRALPLVLALCVSLIAMAGPALAVPRFFPNQGDLLYDGRYYADSYMLWDDLGGHKNANPGYEHDLTLNTTYLASCTAYSNLPSQYDDCPTAGWFEGTPGKSVYGFGSYVLKAVFEDMYYVGTWNFSGGVDGWSPFTLSAQEVYSRCYPLYNIWCMEGTGNLKTLKSGTLWWGDRAYWAWQY